MARYTLNKTVFDANSYEKAIDTSFSKDNTPPPPVVDVINVSEFFKIYDNIFYDIPSTGVINSHEYLIKRSSEYIQPSQINEDTQLLIDEINILRQDLLVANQTILNLQLSSSFTQITSSLNTLP
jgi:hypothetical protein